MEQGVDRIAAAAAGAAADAAADDTAATQKSKKRRSGPKSKTSPYVRSLIQLLEQEQRACMRVHPTSNHRSACSTPSDHSSAPFRSVSRSTSAQGTGRPTSGERVCSMLLISSSTFFPL